GRGADGETASRGDSGLVRLARRLTDPAGEPRGRGARPQIRRHEGEYARVDGGGGADAPRSDRPTDDRGPPRSRADWRHGLQLRARERGRRDAPGGLFSSGKTLVAASSRKWRQTPRRPRASPGRGVPRWVSRAQWARRSAGAAVSKC